jgi:3-oxo-5alpha-steroid 4-dehydrogenase
LIHVNGDNLAAELAEYNKMARGEIDDPFEKTQEDIAQLDEGSLIAIDIGLAAKLFPCPILTLGGLKVNEATGGVLDNTGKPIEGLFAAGRNAIGIASWNYISGLSIADCVYSGRRAANAISED